MSLLHRGLVLVLAGGGVATAAWPFQDETKPVVTSGAEKDEAKAASKELRNKERELRYSQMQQEIDEAKAKSERLSATVQFEHLRKKLELARAERAAFEESVPTTEASGRLRVKRSEWNVEAQRQELEELRAMYRKEEFAELTKELVLQRGERQLEFAQIDLAITQAEVAAQAGARERKRSSLELEVSAAEQAANEQRTRIERMDLEWKLAQRKAEDRANDLREECAELKEKAEIAGKSLDQRVKELEKLLKERAGGAAASGDPR